MVEISSVSIKGKLDLMGKAREFLYDGTTETLSLGGVSLNEANAMLRYIDDSAPRAAQPVTAAEVEEEAPAPEAAAPIMAKQAKQAKKARKSPPPQEPQSPQEPPAPESTPTVKAQERKPRKRRSEKAAAELSGAGTIDAPIDAILRIEAENEAEAEESRPEMEPVDLSAPMATHPESTIPEGWEECLLDGKMQVIHTACGSSECLCHLGAESEDAPQNNSDATQDKPDAVEPEQAASSSEEQESSTDAGIEVVDNTESAPTSGDPLIEKLKDTNRLLHVLDTIIQSGYEDEEAIYAKCGEIKADVPALARISPSTWEDRVRRAIGVTLPPK